MKNVLLFFAFVLALAPDLMAQDKQAVEAVEAETPQEICLPCLWLQRLARKQWAIKFGMGQDKQILYDLEDLNSKL